MLPPKKRGKAPPAPPNGRKIWVFRILDLIAPITEGKKIKKVQRIKGDFFLKSCAYNREQTTQKSVLYYSVYLSTNNQESEFSLKLRL